MSLLIRRSGDNGVSVPPSRLDPACKMAAKFPALWEFLTLLKWDDGSTREPGSVSFFFQDGSLKAAVSDRDANLVAFVSADGLASLLQSLEAGLAHDKLDWRRPREQGGGRARK